jgi:hypothetical protein
MRANQMTFDREPLLAVNVNSIGAKGDPLGRWRNCECESRVRNLFHSLLLGIDLQLIMS